MVTINNDAVIFIIGKKYKGEELLKLGVSMNYEIKSSSSKVYFVSMFIRLCLIIYMYMYMEVFLNCLKLCY